MKLYYFETANGRKPCTVAKYLDLPVEYVHVDLSKGEHKSPDFIAMNPNAKIPALLDGDALTWESNAIMAQLALKAGSDLWPADDMKRIDIMRWMLWETAHFGRHAGRLTFERVNKPTFLGQEPDAREVDDAMGYFKRFAGVLNEHLIGRDYLVGNALTIADFGVAAYLPIADQAGLPLDGMGEIKRWHGKLNELDAWREPFPQR